MTKTEATKFAKLINGKVVFIDLTNEWAVDTELTTREISEILQAEAIEIESAEDNE